MMILIKDDNNDAYSMMLIDDDDDDDDNDDEDDNDIDGDCKMIMVLIIITIISHFRQLKIEGSTSLYITKLANVFFASVVETGKEFRRIFSKGSNASGQIASS